MIIIKHMCVPPGQAMRTTIAHEVNSMKHDNRRVIAAMLAEGLPVHDNMADMGLKYVPEQHELDASGEPIIRLYGIYDMIERGTFSCGDASGWESAVWEEKYGIPTECLSVAQGDDDMHAVFAAIDRVVDPTFNFLHGRREPIPRQPRHVKLARNSCSIEGGRVVCDEDPACFVDERGVWSCPIVPGLSGRRENVKEIRGTSSGRWARTRSGAVVPVGPRRSR